MKLDLYTKILLTIIAIFLVFNFIGTLSTPKVAQAQWGAKFGHLQVSSHLMGLYVFNEKTGDVWSYDLREDREVIYIGKLKDIGKPLVK